MRSTTGLEGCVVAFETQIAEPDRAPRGVAAEDIEEFPYPVAEEGPLTVIAD